MSRRRFMTVHATSIRRSQDIASINATETAPRWGFYRSFAKRLFDIFAVVISLPIMIPFMGILSAIIAMDGHSPVFRQDRIGKDGRRFVMWKFRTMVPDAETLLDSHLSANEGARHEWDAKQKLSFDPRVTRIGRLLRRTSLDELPQLFNVLRGEMSLIGPRPMMPCQQALYPGQAYYRLRPGMTGSWQVSARHNSDFAERAHYDDLYDSELSFLNDTRILIATTAVVLRGTGV